MTDEMEEAAKKKKAAVSERTSHPINDLKAGGKQENPTPKPPTESYETLTKYYREMTVRYNKHQVKSRSNIRRKIDSRDAAI